MKILAIEIENEGIEWQQAAGILQAEAMQVYQLYLADCIREIYFNEHKNAVLILECESKVTAQELLNTLPLVQKGMIRFELSELRPYDGFRRIMQ